MRAQARTQQFFAIFAFIGLLTPQVLLAQVDKNISDDRITNAINRQLFGAKAIDANVIDVTSNDGVVTLEGTVNNILAKDRAIRVVRMTKGVKTVIDRMDVAKGQIPDPKLHSNIEKALASDPATDSWEILVSIVDGKATIGGTVESFGERDLAEKVVRSVKGVTEVENNIDVDYKTERSDSEIVAEIRQKMQWDVRLDDEMINVEVSDGAVKMVGSVGSAYERQLARSNAWVAGVKSIDDEQLSVNWWSRDEMQRKTPWADLENREIETAIKTAFRNDPRVKHFNPEVTVENGVVTLSGIVDNLKAKFSAAQTAKNTVGVLRVNNYLKVRNEKQRDDKAIRKEILNALKRDYLVSEYDMTVYVNDGMVKLFGDVDSYFEKSQAQDIAAKVNGVTGVSNNLNIAYEYPVYSYQHYDWDPTLYDYDFDYQSTSKKPDHEIQSAIESELWWSPWVTYNQVDVSVDEGVATLTGTVDTWSERQSAAENAIEGGAYKVVNKLAVKY